MISLMYYIALGILCLIQFSFGFSPVSLKTTSKPFKSFSSISPTVSLSRSFLKPHFATISSDALSIDDWKFLDAVYLITTDKSDNIRLQQTQEALRACNLLDLVQIRKFKTDDNNRIRGCYTSHMAVLKEIQRQFGNRRDYQVLILEDNIEVTKNLKKDVINSIQSFLNQQKQASTSSKTPANLQNAVNEQLWDVFHLAYMMYVPGLKLLQLNRNPILRTDIQGYSREDSRRFVNQPWAKNIVQMFAEKSAVVGTSAYVISRNGVEKLLARDKKLGFTDAIPNIMAELFPETRFACYPMIFHRAGRVNSLVNPQLDNFRRVMFNPAMYTTWEKLMVGTGLRNNELFPTLTVTLLITTLASIVNIVYRLLHPAEEGVSSALTSVSLTGSTPAEISANFLQLIGAMFPLFIALWGASLFKPGNTGSGFAAVKDSSSNSSDSK
eukprot:gene9597-10421_t